VFIEDYTEIASSLGRFDWAVMKFGYRLVGLQSSKKKYVVERYGGE